MLDWSPTIYQRNLAITSNRLNRTDRRVHYSARVSESAGGRHYQNTASPHITLNNINSQASLLKKYFVHPRRLWRFNGIDTTACYRVWKKDDVYGGAITGIYQVWRFVAFRIIGRCGFKVRLRHFSQLNHRNYRHWIWLTQLITLIR